MLGPYPRRERAAFYSCRRTAIGSGRDGSLREETLMRPASNGVMKLFVFVLAVWADTAFAQSRPSNVHQTTTSPADARFEIVQSQLAARWTFRLDRYTGRIHQLVKTWDDGAAWESMPVEGIPDISKPNRPRFVVFTSGIAAQHTFLIDSNTGQTWRLETRTFPDPDSEGDPLEITGWWQFERK